VAFAALNVVGIVVSGTVMWLGEQAFNTMAADGHPRRQQRMSEILIVQYYSSTISFAYSY
jgi:cobalamin biosynthesis protein CobT